MICFRNPVRPSSPSVVIVGGVKCVLICCLEKDDACGYTLLKARRRVMRRMEERKPRVSRISICANLEEGKRARSTFDIHVRLYTLGAEKTCGSSTSVVTQ